MLKHLIAFAAAIAPAQAFAVCTFTQDMVGVNGPQEYRAYVSDGMSYVVVDAPALVPPGCIDMTEELGKQADREDK